MPFPTVGVQSWSLRHFNTIDTLLPQVRALGLDRVELCGVQCNFDDPVAHQPVIAACAAAGVQVAAMGVQTFTANEAVERQWFAFAKAAGTQVITCHFRVDSFTRAVPIAVKLAEEYGVKREAPVIVFTAEDAAHATFITLVAPCAVGEREVPELAVRRTGQLTVASIRRGRGTPVTRHDS